MTPHPKDDLDRVLDEVLASVVAGEPTRVNAASVREATTMAGRQRSLIPVWIGLAAVLVAGFAIAFLHPGSSLEGTRSVRKPVGTYGGEKTPEGVSTEPLQAVPEPRRPARRATLVRSAGNMEEIYEGLPRLVILPLDLPEPLLTVDLEASGIHILSIELAPLPASFPSADNQK